MTYPRGGHADARRRRRRFIAGRMLVFSLTTHSARVPRQGAPRGGRGAVAAGGGQQRDGLLRHQAAGQHRRQFARAAALRRDVLVRRVHSQLGQARAAPRPPAARPPLAPCLGAQDVAVGTLLNTPPGLGPDGYCSPRQRTPFKSRNEG
jgi:hypothetical protein